jgi:hypothetical protein
MHHFRWVTTSAAALAVLAFTALALAASGPVDVSGLSPFAACAVGGPAQTPSTAKSSRSSR